MFASHIRLSKLCPGDKIMSELSGKTTLVAELERQVGRSLTFTSTRTNVDVVANCQIQEKTTQSKGELSGKVALVTGAGRGLGRAIALAIAQAGGDVAVNYQTQKQAAQETCRLVKQQGCRAIAVRADVSVAADVARMIEVVEQQLGTVSILVNNVGLVRPKAIEEIQERDWDEAIAVNLKSVFLVTQATLPRMRKQGWGRIINLSSIAAQTGGIVGLHYAAAKAGILGLTHAYAAQLIGEGITVNALAPALIETETVSANFQVHPEQTPVGRFGTAKEVAEAAVMLASNGYITGQTINVNGGMYFN
jgi:3-oxoacyl-[acyl-carrier protein] reductase